MSKIVAIIPARSGSKRLEGKNKKLLLGKPLIEYTIEEALKCDFIDEIIVSTNDKDIINICVPYIERYYDRFKIIERPEELCQDDTPMWEVIEYIYDYECLPLDTTIILLQPTSPLRIDDDIYRAYDKFLAFNSCVVSMVQVDDKTYKLNGAIYINYLKFIFIDKGFKLIQPYIMPKERSIDIDTLYDFELVEKLMKERLNKP